VGEESVGRYIERDPETEIGGTLEHETGELGLFGGGGWCGEVDVELA
jgi:hypothetical protein